MKLSVHDIDVIEKWWVQKSRVNFLAYRQYMRGHDFKYNWFIADMCKQLQDFYIDLVAGKRPVLLIQSPPQHGKSWTVADFISWLSGKNPALRTIYATYSDTLGVRCNLSQQRQMSSYKYNQIFPDTMLGDKTHGCVRNTNLLEFIGPDGKVTNGQFRNTTTGGPVTGESLDLGVIDDAVKGREQANSITWSQKIWEWFTDDFGTRFSENAGLLVVMTRWTVHDIIGRLKNTSSNFASTPKIVNYQAIATKDEEHRKTGEALFPALKSISFLKARKEVMADPSWESLYQGNPTIIGGNLFKDHWWKWWKVVPPLKFKFIVADTAQKDKKQNDWTVFQLWGYGIDNNIYLLDKLREKFEAPDLRKQAEIFYKKHDIKKTVVTDPILRGMFIEDKSSGIGLIQELKRKSMKIFEVPRHTDKVFRAEDASPYIESGRVYLNVDIKDVGNLTNEAREFPNGEFDDDIDTLMSAVEIAFINKDKGNSLKAAMEAD